MVGSGHIPVLCAEAMALLAPRRGSVAVDCTAGLGGHAEVLARGVGPAGLVVGFDLDAANLAVASERVRATGTPFIARHESFVHAPRRLREGGRAAEVVLADLGFSSSQMDDPGAGFSFRAEGPLDMRYDRGPSADRPTAADLLDGLSEPELAELIATCGEEPLARKIARKLAQSRRHRPIETTVELARIVAEAYGGRARSSRMHPATRTFMALRIAVNGELEALGLLLEAVASGAGAGANDGWLVPGARVAIISFHSLEDRMVKRAFADLSARGLACRLTKRPVRADLEEVAGNPRSRSARLRAVRLRA